MTSESQRRMLAVLPPLAFALALGLAAWVIVASLPAAKLDPDSDDGLYLLYMDTVHRQGLSAFPGLFEEWNREPDNWIYPPPSRVGFIVVSALWAGLWGASLASLQALSVASHLLGSLVNYLFARKHLGEPRALFVGALWIFSPLVMGLSRLALTDSFIALCTLLSVWLLIDLVEAPKSRRRLVCFMAAFASMVLVKEQTALLAVPFAAFVLIERCLWREPLGIPTFLAAFVLPGIAVVSILVLAAGGLSPLLETSRIVLTSPATNDYAIRYGSGPWFRYLVDYLCLSPATTLLAMAFAGVLAMRLKGGQYDRVLVCMGLLAVFFLFEFSFFTKNVRYALVLELSIRVFAVCMLVELFGSANRARSAVLCGVAVAALCWLDWRTFDLYWVRYRGYDVHTQFLLGGRQMVPFPKR